MVLAAGQALFGEEVYVIQAGRNITILLDARDDPQTQRLEVIISGEGEGSGAAAADTAADFDVDGVRLAPHACLI